jgi:F5/8 type C domain
MQKRIIRDRADAQAAHGNWLDLVTLTEVELTSEDAAHPIEAALVPGSGPGWRAADTGPQSVRILFHTPQRLRRIRLRFEEADAERTQEFVLRWSPDRGRTYHEIVRQQYTFAPAGATSEVEDLAVELDAVTALELTIIPDQQGQTYASVAEWRIA